MKKNCLLQSGFLAFSLIEMLMALLVASLLLAALAPVITKRMDDSMKISIEGEIPGKKTKTHQIKFGSDECPAGGELKTSSDGSQYCEGIFTVPAGYNGAMTVTVVGGGGGGGAAATAGYTEFTAAGSSNTFTVPALVNQIETTLVGGGAGGGASGKTPSSKIFIEEGQKSWTPPTSLTNTSTDYKYVKVTGCGGGGGSAGSRIGRVSTVASPVYGGGGGSGAYGTTVLSVSNNTAWTLHIGGGGGGGGYYGCNNGQAGGYFAGGGGGGGFNEHSGGGGGGSGTTSGGGGGTACSAPNRNFDSYVYAQLGANGENGSQAGGGAGGKRAPDTTGNYTYSYGGNGGAGGLIAGGGGGGGVLGTSAGGGGGGATRILIGSVEKAIWPGGGGGSSGTHCDNKAGVLCECYQGGAGGGGGGAGGGKGGDSPYSYWQNGYKVGNPGMGGSSLTFMTHADGTGASGGIISGSIFGTSNCSGAEAVSSNVLNTYPGKNGKPGAIKIEYPTNASGGGGGGGGSIVPYQTVSVTPLEKLTIDIAKRAAGGITGGYNSNGTFIEGVYGETGFKTTLSRNTGLILSTFFNHQTHCGNHYGVSTIGGEKNIPNNCNGRAGAISRGIINTQVVMGGTWNGATNSSGLASDNRPYGTTTYGSANSNGGRGGHVEIFGQSLCQNAEGGTASHPNGYDATGYGCGGGGGSQGGDGGSGSGGYARISWNKYWNIATGEYDLVKTGGGGGGASGNIMTYTIPVSSGEKIKYRIGKGGDGAYATAASSIQFTNAKKGGDTIFAYNTSKAVKAGGGGFGTTPSMVPDNTNITNGAAGNTATVCHYGATDYLNNGTYCKKGIKGMAANGATGGNGASLSAYNNISGTGGKAKPAGRGDTNGSNADTSGYGAGGSGASLKDMDKVSAGEAISNPTIGGNGSNGIIILKWEE